MKGPSRSLLPWPLFALCAALGALWTVTALSKGLLLLDTGNATPSPASWSDGFPVPLQLSVVGAELLIGFWLLFGNRVTGLLVAILLLGVFSIALLIAPPAVGQSCGCGAIAEVLPVEPIARNALLAGSHAAVLALVAYPRPRAEVSATPHSA